ncbi:hypothetical protein CFC21_095117 [Triticum aestivum]|uniref:F-box domain-containing protein n=2 Tax=Triticum aestivum TaxID=4565 RepID=A0A3B6R6T4_WHEAT|nr:F-box protein At5g65850-like [Triticum aestivum]KAF7092658.1 hypothetical protein CFC21_095117 [Triticum aestivum]
MPAGGGEASNGRAGKEQSHPPAIRRRDESRPAPPFPAVASQEKRKQRKQRQPAAAEASVSSEGPLAEILARLPYRSLCRFQCVSKQWAELCSDLIRSIKTAPQTLSGFFHNNLAGNLCFSNLSGGRPLVDASLPFLRESYQRFKLQQCSTSLLLCKCWESEDDDEFDFVVCNPMTEQWAVLPPIKWQPGEDDEGTECFDLMYPFLVFDPAAPSRFVVFAPLMESVDIVAVYSHETGQWAPSSGWEDIAYPAVNPECAVLLNGMMHFLHLTVDEPLIAVLDMEGEVSREIAVPDDMLGAIPGYGSVGCSQGLLHAWYMDPHDYELSVWVLKDYATEEWTLKHTVDVPRLFGETESDEEEDYRRQEDGAHKYDVFAIHPEHNVIFLTDWKEVNLSYDMDSRQVHPMCTTGDFLGGLPFIPCFADLARPLQKSLF